MTTIVAVHGSNNITSNFYKNHKIRNNKVTFFKLKFCLLYSVHTAHFSVKRKHLNEYNDIK